MLNLDECIKIIKIVLCFLLEMTVNICIYITLIILYDIKLYYIVL